MGPNTRLWPGGSTPLWPGSVPWKARTDTLLEPMSGHRFWWAILVVVGIAVSVTLLVMVTR